MRKCHRVTNSDRNLLEEAKLGPGQIFDELGGPEDGQGRKL
jgi:hypothetical protein